MRQQRQQQQQRLQAQMHQAIQTLDTGRLLCLLCSLRLLQRQTQTPLPQPTVCFHQQIREVTPSMAIFLSHQAPRL